MTGSLIAFPPSAGSFQWLRAPEAYTRMTGRDAATNRGSSACAIMTFPAARHDGCERATSRQQCVGGRLQLASKPMSRMIGSHRWYRALGGGSLEQAYVLTCFSRSGLDVWSKSAFPASE